MHVRRIRWVTALRTQSLYIYKVKKNPTNMRGHNASTKANLFRVVSTRENSALCIEYVDMDYIGFESVRNQYELDSPADVFQEWSQSAMYNCRIPSDSVEAREEFGPKQDSNGERLWMFALDCLFNILLCLIALMWTLALVLCDSGFFLS
jgi:hypothetical protein